MAQALDDRKLAMVANGLGTVGDRVRCTFEGLATL